MGLCIRGDKTPEKDRSIKRGFVIRNLYCKINSLALIVFFLPIFVYSANSITLENSIVDRVTTKVTLSFDKKKISYYTNSFNVKDALAEKGVEVGEFDVVEPPLDSKLKGGKIDILIKRAERFLVVDNGVKSLVFSAYDEPNKILEQNKIKTYPEDRVFSDLILDFYSDNSLGKKIVIERAPVIFVNVDGKRIEVRSWAQTIGEALHEKGILTSDRDRIEPPLKSPVLDKMEVVVVRVSESEVKELERVPFRSDVIKDYNLEIGKSYVKQKGREGLKENTYKIISENGIMVSKILLFSRELNQSVDEIIVKGAKPYNANFWWPTIVDASLKFGVDPQKMYNVMICESGGNPYAGYYYKGLFQYSPTTWAGASSAYPGGVYAGAPITDGVAQIYVTAWKVSKQGWRGWGCA